VRQGHRFHLKKRNAQKKESTTRRGGRRDAGRHQTEAMTRVVRKELCLSQAATFATENEKGGDTKREEELDSRKKEQEECFGHRGQAKTRQKVEVRDLGAGP